MIVLLAVALLDWQGMQAEGDQHYRVGEFESALDDYRSAWLAGAPDGCVEQPLGNTFYVLGRPARALYFYRIAEILRPRSRSVAANVRVALRGLGRAGAEGGGFPAWVDGLLRVITLAEALVVLFSSALFLSVLAVAGPILGRVSRVLAIAFKWGRRGAAMVLVAAALSGAAHLTSPSRVMIGEAGAALLARPGQGGVRARLGPGAEGRLIEMRDGWSHLQLEGGREGWVRTDLVWALPRHDLAPLPRSATGPVAGAARATPGEPR